MSKILVALMLFAGAIFANGIKEIKMTGSDVFIISVAKKVPHIGRLIAYDEKSGELIKNTQARINEHNVVLIKNEKFIALVDTGFADTAGILKERLSSLNVGFDDITHVIVTHGHFDHVGGVLGANGDRNFKNAKMMIDRIEYDYWLNSSNENVKNALKSFENVEFFDHNKPLFDSNTKISAVKAYGHTPGHNLVTIEDERLKFVFVADLFHVYDIQILDPKISINFDVDQAMAVKTRLEILNRLKDGKTLINGSHTPFVEPVVLP